MTFEFTPTDDGFRIHDTIENAWTDLDVGGATEPAPADVDVFRVPLDTAVRVRTERLDFPENFAVVVRDGGGEVTAENSLGESTRLPEGSYELETTLLLFKLYLDVTDTSVTIEDDATGTSFTFDSETTVTLGFRSIHSHPAGVVTTTQDPRDLMRAVSTFGTAMKTFSPERSFPTLRGHPPELAVRGQTSIPDQFTPPDTGITVVVPPEYAAVFASTPLAYYLGATIEPGLEPGLIAGDVHHSFRADDLSESVFDLLRHCFVLDTVVRSAGLYPMEMAVQRTLEERIDLDRRSLYDLPIDERTAAYLEYPLDATRDLLTWPAVADIDPVPLNAEALPYLVYRMTAIRSPADGKTQISDCCAESTARSDSTASTSPLRSFTPGEPDSGAGVTFVDPAAFDADHNIWVGDGLPVRGSKPTLGSFLRATDAELRNRNIHVRVVVTDGSHFPTADRIAAEYSNDGFEVTVHDDPTASELKSILLDDADFLHYRGPVSPAGLECFDGPLDLRILPRTGVSAFFLDGECSYRQGLPLVRVGAIAGVVSTNDATPPGLNTGLTLARLLDFGYPLHGAVDVLERCHPDVRYTVVGDAYHQICRTSHNALYLEADPSASTETTITPRVRFYDTPQEGIGTAYFTGGTIEGYRHLAGFHSPTYHRETFSDVADQIECPILVDGELHWPDDYTPEELWDLLQ